jgi:hypothetical protein
MVVGRASRSAVLGSEALAVTENGTAAVDVEGPAPQGQWLQPVPPLAAVKSMRCADKAAALLSGMPASKSHRLSTSGSIALRTAGDGNQTCRPVPGSTTRHRPPANALIKHSTRSSSLSSSFKLAQRPTRRASLRWLRVWPVRPMWHGITDLGIALLIPCCR